MLLHKTEGNNKTIYYSDVVNARGNCDVLIDGKIYKNNEIQMVLVSSYADTALLGSYGAGTVAFTAGFTNMWQKAPNGTWVAFE